MGKIKVVLSEEAHEFICQQDDKTRLKINANIQRVADGMMDISFFKKLRGSEIWEFRTKYSTMEYRVLAFWDKQEHLVIATHGFVKKTQKTPQKEIDKAEKIMNEYYTSKKIKI